MISHFNFKRNYFRMRLNFIKKKDSAAIWRHCPLSVSINLFCEKFHFDLIAVPCLVIAVRARRRIYGLWAIHSKQHLAENRFGKPVLFGHREANR